MPGLIALQRTPRGPHSTAVSIVIPSTPAFVGVYAPRKACALSALIDAMLTMLPRPAASMRLPTTCVQ